MASAVSPIEALAFAFIIETGGSLIISPVGIPYHQCLASKIHSLKRQLNCLKFTVPKPACATLGDLVCWLVRPLIQLAEFGVASRKIPGRIQTLKNMFAAPLLGAAATYVKRKTDVAKICSQHPCLVLQQHT